MEKIKIDIVKQLADFQVCGSKFDIVLLNYGPLLAMMQFIISMLFVILSGVYASISGNSQLITWAVLSPVYIGVLITLALEGMAMRGFIKKIRSSLLSVWNEGILGWEPVAADTEEHYRSFLLKFEKDLNSSKRIYLGLTMLIMGVLFFWVTGHIPYIYKVLTSDESFGFKSIVLLVNMFVLLIPAAIAGYAVGVGLWKSVLTAIYIRRFCKDFILQIQPNHPDGAGGLKPLGSLILALASLMIVASLALSGVILLADYFSYINTIFYSKLFLGITIALSLIVFIWPLMSAHERMLIEKMNLNQLSVEIGKRIFELEKLVQKDLQKMDYKKRDDIFLEIDSLKNLYKRVGSTPTWPFDREIILKFATPQVFSLLSLIGVAEPIVGTIRSIFLALTSGN